MAGDGTKYFKPGNKLGGRTHGSRHKHLVLLEKMGQDNAVEIVQTVIDLARNNDTACLKMLMDRMWPIPKTQSFIETQRLKDIKTQTDVDTAMTFILEDVGATELSIEEGLDLQKIVETKGASIQKCNQAELDAIRELMEAHNNKV